MLTDEQVGEVIAASTAVLARQGLSPAGMAEIARTAGVPLGELTGRFATTEELFRALLREVVVHPLTRASRELPAGPPSDQLRNYAGRAWEILNTPVFAGLHRIVMAEVFSRPELARYFATQVVGPVRERIEVTITRGIARGEFRAVIPSAAARAIAGALVAQAIWCNHADLWGHEAGGTPSRVVPETIGLILEGLHRKTTTTQLTDGGTHR
jgi:AcrR family transcriptional regulator